ncbi:MAG: YtxH domain-containing protein [Chryseosolibacter sp.]
MTTAKAVLGVLAGMAAGAALGVLFAPEKGKETRRRISRKGEDLVESMEDLAETMEERMEKKFDELVAAVDGRVKKQVTPSDAKKASVQ